MTARSDTGLAELLEPLDGAVCISLWDLSEMIAPPPLNAWGHIDFRTRAARQWFARWTDLMRAGIELLDAGLAEILAPADGEHPDLVGITTAGRRYVDEIRLLGKAAQEPGGLVMSSNYHVRAILALRIPARQKFLLLGLETFTRREGGWREAGTEALAEAAGQSVNTAIRARGDMVAADLIDYRRGNGAGHVSTYRIRAPGVADHLLDDPPKVPILSTFPEPEGTQKGTQKVPKQPKKGTHRNPVTSANAFGALKESVLKAAAPARARATGSAAAAAAANSGQANEEKTMTDDQDQDFTEKDGHHGPPGGTPAEPLACPRCGRNGLRLGGLYVTGACPACGQQTHVKASGRLCAHDNRRTGQSCPGGGQPPLTPEGQPR